MISHRCRNVILTSLVLIKFLILIAQIPTEAALQHFSSDAYAGMSLTYSLATNGSVEQYSDRNLTDTRHFSLNATVQFNVKQKEADDTMQVSLVIEPIHAVGLHATGPLSTVTLHGLISSNGFITAVDTPDYMAAIGMDIDQLFLGWTVPSQHVSDTTTPETLLSNWQVPIKRDRSASLRTPINYTLTGSYQATGVAPFRSRRVTSVLGSFRGDATIYEGMQRIRVKEVGSGNFEVDPDSGRVTVSSVSLVSTVDIDDDRATRTSRMKSTTTTTLELVDVASFEFSIDQSSPMEQPTPIVTGPVQSADAPPADSNRQEDHKQEETPKPGDWKSTTPHSDATEQVDLDSQPLTEDPSLNDGSDPITKTAPLDNAYRDPANRFEIVLPKRFDFEHSETHLSLRGTRFSGPGNGEFAYVYVTPLSDPSADAAQIAHSILINYSETLPGFTLLGGPKPDQLDGVAAYRAHYEYLDVQGRKVTEWGIFARKGDRTFYVQYTPGADDIRNGERILLQLVNGFSFGTQLSGQIPTPLLSDSLEQFTDEQQNFNMLLPSHWPLTERADEGSSTTFTEIGERGYLTVFMEAGIANITARQVLHAWNEEWKHEDGYKLIEDLNDTELNGQPATTFTYSWTGSANVSWTRRIAAGVNNDLFYAIVIDYVSEGYDERLPTFTRMIESFQIRSFTPDTTAVPEDETVKEESTPGTEKEINPEQQLEPFPFEEPENDETAIMIGRVLTRYPDAHGETVESWGQHLTIVVRAGDTLFEGMTDGDGYVYVTNLPRGIEDYEVLRFTGHMLGIDDPVELSFVDLFVGRQAPRVANLETLIITLTSEHAVQIDIVNAEQLHPDEPSPSNHFINTFPSSGWSEFVKEIHR